jgi:hypothetical protein
MDLSIQYLKVHFQSHFLHLLMNLKLIFLLLIVIFQFAAKIFVNFVINFAMGLNLFSRKLIFQDLHIS